MASPLEDKISMLETRRWAKSKGKKVDEADPVMTFGKHKGELWSTIPDSYKSWMKANNIESPVGNPVMTFGKYKGELWNSVP